MSSRLRLAGETDLGILLPLVRAFHELEGIETAQREAALLPLLRLDSPFGRVWLIETDPPPAPGNAIGELVDELPDRSIGEPPGRSVNEYPGEFVCGYVAVCFGYSIEVGGRDAFLDEIFVTETYRGKGFGSQAIESIIPHLVALEVRALHLEVDRTNEPLKQFYQEQYFQPRDRYHLMTRNLTSPQEG